MEVHDLLSVDELTVTVSVPDYSDGVFSRFYGMFGKVIHIYYTDVRPIAVCRCHYLSLLFGCGCSMGLLFCTLFLKKITPNYVSNLDGSIQYYFPVASWLAMILLRNAPL